MARRLVPIIYSEVDTFFRQNDRNDLVLSENGDAVADSIRNIVLTIPGERVMNPDFGCGLHHLLFEPMDDHTAHLIGQEILQSIEQEDDRVVIERILVTPNYDTQRYDVVVDYYIKKLPQNINRVELTLTSVFS